MNREAGMDLGQASPALVREIGDRVTQIISDCLVKRTTQSITDTTGVADLRTLFNEPLPRQGTPHEILLDLFAERSWLVFGLKPAQLAKLGAAGGAATGAGLDALTGGASLMLGAALGAVVGGAMGWLTADQLSELEVINKPFGERLLRCGPARSANLGFVLLGRARLHHAAVAGRSHAERDALALDAGDESAAGLRVPDEATRKTLAVTFEAAEGGNERRCVE